MDLVLLLRGDVDPGPAAAAAERRRELLMLLDCTELLIPHGRF